MSLKLIPFQPSLFEMIPVVSELHDVPLQHLLMLQNPVETEAAQVQSFKASFQDEFCQAPAHRRRVLQAVAAEAGGEVHVLDERVQADEAVLVEGVVVVETGPRAHHLTGRRADNRSGQTCC